MTHNTDMKKAEAILAWAVEKMEERYSLLARAGVRHITSYNQLGEKEIIKRLAPESEEECQNIPFKIPFVVIVADELEADWDQVRIEQAEAEKERMKKNGATMESPG